MYAVVRHYHFKTEDGEKIDKLVQEGFVPFLKKARGFVRRGSVIKCFQR